MPAAVAARIAAGNSLTEPARVVVSVRPPSRAVCAAAGKVAMRTETRKRRWPRLTRRQTLTAAASATLGAAALAVPGLSSAGDDKGAAAGVDETIVVHLRDGRSDAMDVFVGESRIEVRDRGLADRLRRAARR